MANQEERAILWEDFLKALNLINNLAEQLKLALNTLFLIPLELYRLNALKELNAEHLESLHVFVIKHYRSETEALLQTKAISETI